MHKHVPKWGKVACECPSTDAGGKRGSGRMGRRGVMGERQCVIGDEWDSAASKVNLTTPTAAPLR